MGPAGWASTAVILSDERPTIAKIAATRGAIGWVPNVALAVNAPRGVKPVILRALWVIAAPQVSAIHEGSSSTSLAPPLDPISTSKIED